MTKNNEMEISFDQLDEVDCVHVIRCKDCCNGYRKRAGHIECTLDHQFWEPDDYCSYGERRKD